MEILDVETEDRNGLVHVALKGELDLSTVAKVQDELRRVEANEPPVVVLDLSLSIPEVAYTAHGGDNLYVSSHYSHGIAAFATIYAAYALYGNPWRTAL